MPAWVSQVSIPLWLNKFYRSEELAQFLLHEQLHPVLEPHHRADQLLPAGSLQGRDQLQEPTGSAGTTGHLVCEIAQVAVVR